MAAANNQLTVTTLDGSEATLDAAGKVTRLRAVPDGSPITMTLRRPGQTAGTALHKQLLGKSVAKQVLTIQLSGATLTAVSYWGGNLQLFTAKHAEIPAAPAAGHRAALLLRSINSSSGLADGRVVALATK